MDSKRQAEVFRAFVKDALRRKGLKFERDDILREIGREEKEFNARHKLSRPLDKVEFLGMYLELMKELAAEHFTMIEEKIAEIFVQRNPDMPAEIFTGKKGDMPGKEDVEPGKHHPMLGVIQ